MRLRIVNRSGRTRTWAFDFNAQTSAYIPTHRRSRFDFTVADTEDRQFEVLVPLSGGSDAGWVQMSVLGYGVANPGHMNIVGNNTGSRVAVSGYATLDSAELRNRLAYDGGTGSPALIFDATLLSTDWRAYSGLVALWLRVDEWKLADAAVQRALEAWVHTGGRLVLVDPSDTPTPSPIETLGLGVVVTIPAGLTEEDASRFEAAVLPSAWPSRDTASWASSLIEPIETHRGLLSLVLVGYLVLAGPVNLFVFSPGTKRVRLFWTMPAIALGASAVMASVIVLQDGVGGAGYRANFIYLQPERNHELIIQEQVSRTGALARRSFDVVEPVIMKNLQTAHDQFRSTAELASVGTRYTGDWFRSRSVQAHELSYVRASRARIELARVDAGVPTILSSIDMPIETVYYRDSTGTAWFGENVLAGRPASLTRASESQYEQFWRDISFQTAGPRLRMHIDAVRGVKGAFLATVAPEHANVAVDTLPSIEWSDGPVVLGGHIDPAPKVASR